MSEIKSEVKGKVIEVLPQETGSGAKGNWFKQNFIIETEGQYPKKVCLQAWGDKCDQIPEVNTIGTFSFNPESREYNGKWYTDLRVWKFDVEKKPALTKDQKANIEKAVEVLGLTSDEDELPF
jgi:hypothetical protein